jgi:hypothetical protein
MFNYIILILILGNICIWTQTQAVLLFRIMLCWTQTRITFLLNFIIKFPKKTRIHAIKLVGLCWVMICQLQRLYGIDDTGGNEEATDWWKDSEKSWVNPAFPTEEMYGMSRSWDWFQLVTKQKMTPHSYFWHSIIMFISVCKNVYTFCKLHLHLFTEKYCLHCFYVAEYVCKVIFCLNLKHYVTRQQKTKTQINFMTWVGNKQLIMQHGWKLTYRS